MQLGRAFVSLSLVLIAIVACLLASAAQEPSLSARIDALVAAARAQDQIPGLSISVAVNGSRVFAKGYGSASISSERPVTPDTQYRTASVSKAFTAVAVLQLAARGKIDLDRPAREYCPELAPLNGAPTVRHFLAHQSGMRHPSDDEDTGIRGAFPRLGPALGTIVKETLKFPPGTKALYTSWGYAALGCVIEGATQQSYADAMKANVLDPAGLRNTAFDAPSFTSPTFSPGFRLQRGKLAPSEVVDTRFKTPASGVISTVNDLTQFAMALFDGTLLPARMFQEMLTVPPLPAGEASPYSMGWIVAQSSFDVPVFSYNGSMEGTTAFLLIVPERRTAVALLANRERFVPGVQPIVIGAARAALSKPPQ